VWAAVSVRGGRDQPAETRALIGDHGQRLAADVVTVDGVGEAWVTRRFELD
jgi:hypothetical protein